MSQAREAAETGAKAALEALAVHHYEPYIMSFEDRKLRNHLRVRARQLAINKTARVSWKLPILFGDVPMSTGIGCFLPAFWPKMNS
ncbi:MAG: hypothetical protein BMS9Abin03_505 [Thermodesulfobacteriota bacterium]|nr:MAG: hypothetical protein BMS9Abin03_505 [Thermodesulfobacteriota bacterium]